MSFTPTMRGGKGRADGSDGSDKGRYGFCRRCAEVGIDGLILPDVPFEEKDQFEDACRQNGLDLISLIAPTSEDRIRQIAQEAQGFIYVVSSLGVTGVRTAITTDIGSITSKIREVTSVPCAVGFGISTPARRQQMAAPSRRVIVGSAIIRIIDQYGTDAPPHMGELLRSMKDALRS